MIVKNWRLCTQLAASARKICFRVGMSFLNQTSKVRQLNSWKLASRMWTCQCKKFIYDVKSAFYTPLVYLSLALYN
jgi:hypothetical protein